jgi:hypothetical protein
MRFMTALSLFVATAAFAQTNLVVNGGFEQNGGPGTAKLTGWTIVSQAGGSGSWYAQTGSFPMPSTERCSNESVDAPPSGFAAMSTQSQKGSHILYQDVALPAAAAKVTLTYDLFIYSHAGFANQPTLDYNPIPNTQFRADILNPSAPVDDTGAGVLANIYQSKNGDLRYSQYKRQMIDLTPFAGRTIRLRFAQVDNVDCFNAGIDNVTIIAETCPAAAPSQLAIATECSSACKFFATSSSYVFVACDAYAWDFGDGTTSADASPLHVYTTPGTYAVSLTVTNALGTSTAQTSVTIAPPPPRRRTGPH